MKQRKCNPKPANMSTKSEHCWPITQDVYQMWNYRKFSYLSSLNFRYDDRFLSMRIISFSITALLWGIFLIYIITSWNYLYLRSVHNVGSSSYFKILLILFTKTNLFLFLIINYHLFFILWHSFSLSFVLLNQLQDYWSNFYIH